MTSNKPYLVGAFYDWISDNQLTPHIVVDVSVYGVLVPMAYVNDGQITLNIDTSALGDFSMGEQAIEFSARFGGKLEHMTVPYGAIAAIYAKENGAGTSLPIEHPVDVSGDEGNELPKSTHSTTPAKLTSVASMMHKSQQKLNEETKKQKSKASLKIIK